MDVVVTGNGPSLALLSQTRHPSDVPASRGTTEEAKPNLAISAPAER
jgi:hypothetical protein